MTIGLICVAGAKNLGFGKKPSVYDVTWRYEDGAIIGTLARGCASSHPWFCLSQVVVDGVSFPEETLDGCISSDRVVIEIPTNLPRPERTLEFVAWRRLKKESEQTLGGGLLIILHCEPDDKGK
jgi:hypothetical protein